MSNTSNYFWSYCIKRKRLRQFDVFTFSNRKHAYIVLIVFYFANKVLSLTECIVYFNYYKSTYFFTFESVIVLKKFPVLVYVPFHGKERGWLMVDDF